MESNMKKVLVAEDEESIREFIVINLTRSGYNVEQAENGAHGSAAGRAERFRGRKRRLLLFRGGAGARALSQQRLVRLRRLGKTL